MAQIYIVMSNHQGFDNDMWDHWVIEEEEGYYATIAGAEKRIADLLKKKLDDYVECIPLNDHISMERHEKRKEEIKNNIQYLAEGTEDNGPLECPLYYVKTVGVAD